MVFRRTLLHHSADSRQAPGLHDDLSEFRQASSVSSDLSRQAPRTSDELFGELPKTLRQAPYSFSANTLDEFSDFHRTLELPTIPFHNLRRKLFNRVSICFHRKLNEVRQRLVTASRVLETKHSLEQLCQSHPHQTTHGCSGVLKDAILCGIAVALLHPAAGFGGVEEDIDIILEANATKNAMQITCSMKTHAVVGIDVVEALIHERAPGDGIDAVGCCCCSVIDVARKFHGLTAFFFAGGARLLLLRRWPCLGHLQRLREGPWALDVAADVEVGDCTGASVLYGGKIVRLGCLFLSACGRQPTK
ncbi:hypothetical protein MUK42_32850 [Musa troglodytarum]|uniref:Uncharacterized protein n=1 Tax=Musa troglodytarum TaxID=320322 RepID=A0A9E7F9P2_9LILI|nr:hypothetical protein MUK42_32850 [Musa troglodytarum]